MGNFGRFNFDNYTPTYPSEEAMLTDYLDALRDIVPLNDYKAIFDCFLNNDKKALADFLTKTCATVKKQQDEIKRMDQLAGEIKQLRDRENQLWKETAKLRLKLSDVQKSEAGLDLQIRDMYVEEKKSLNEIARLIGKDKKTVKNRLVKMGVYGRTVETTEDIIKSLTQHLPI